MYYDYYFGNEANQFSFFRIPKELIFNPAFKNMSEKSKLLYGLLLERMGLSIKNNWHDEDGRVFIYYRMVDIANDLGCGESTARRLMKELSDYNLIIKKQQGLNKPNKIYVLNIFRAIKNSTEREKAIESSEFPDRSKVSSPECSEMNGPGCSKMSSQNRSKRAPNNTEKNNTEKSNNNNNEKAKINITKNDVVVVMSLFENDELSDKDAITLLHDSGGDIVKIIEAKRDLDKQSNTIRDIVAWLRWRLTTNDYRPSMPLNKSKKNSFKDFSERETSMEELFAQEQALLENNMQKNLNDIYKDNWE